MKLGREGYSPRERVLSAITHQKPDRVPRDFWAEPPTWNRLLTEWRLRDKEEILQLLDIDIRHLEVPGPAELHLGNGLCQNFWGERYIYRTTPWGPMRDDTKGALAGAQSFGDLERFPWPSPDVFDYSVLPERCRRFDRYALVYGFADVWQRPGLVRGWEPWFVDMVERPEWVHFLCRKFTDFYKEDYLRAAEVTGGRIDIYLLISDLGSQHGPLISPRMFREFVAPYLREMIDWIHHLGGKVLFHSCGSIASFIPELIALGVDILDPIQPAGPTMTPEYLHEHFAGRICFHGGIDMQRLLPFGTPDEVRKEVRRYCEILGGDGGYILAPAHLFQPDVPPENILAMYGKGETPAD